jgi:hypothetical protein
MYRTFSFIFDTEAEAWAAVPKNAVNARVIPLKLTKGFELRYQL